MIDIQDKRRDFFISLGVFFVITGLCVLGFSIPASIAIILFSVGFFFGSRGVEIDPSEKRYRVYWSSWFIKLGEWNDIHSGDYLNLSLSASNSHMTMGGFENQLIASSKTILYILSIYRNGEKIEVIKFKSYIMERKAMDTLANTFRLEYLDEIAQKMEENKLRRR